MENASSVLIYFAVEPPSIWQLSIDFLNARQIFFMLYHQRSEHTSYCNIFPRSVP